MGLIQHIFYVVFVTAEKRDGIESLLVAAGLPVPSPAPQPPVSPRDDMWDGTMEVGALWGQWETECSTACAGPWGIPRLGLGQCSEITSAGCVLTFDFSFWAKVTKTGE